MRRLHCNMFFYDDQSYLHYLKTMITQTCTTNWRKQLGLLSNAYFSILSIKSVLSRGLTVCLAVQSWLSLSSAWRYEVICCFPRFLTFNYDDQSYLHYLKTMITQTCTTNWLKSFKFLKLLNIVKYLINVYCVGLASNDPVLTFYKYW